MKLFNLFGVALAKECFEAVLPKGPAAERGEISIGELKIASEEFFTCAGRDSKLDMTPYHDAMSQPKGMLHPVIETGNTEPRIPLMTLLSYQ